MPLLNRPTEPTHRLPGATFTSLATPSRGTEDVSVWALRLSPGHPGTPHQLTRQEVFVALSGAASAVVGDERHHVRAGDALVVPAGVPFAIEAVGDQDFEALCCLPVGGQAVIGDGEPFTPPWAL